MGMGGAIFLFPLQSTGSLYMMQEEKHDGTQIVAIDGPAGAGKSSVSRQVAKELGFAFLDTGAMYRAATWRALRDDIPLSNQEALVASTVDMALELEETPEGLCVHVDGQDVTDAIRSPEVTRQIWRLDQIPGVRRRLVELQRRFGCRRPTVAEGRDIGTVVFPSARCKIYLDASLHCRARRRAAELEAKGLDVNITELIQEIGERDAQSMNREDSPLRRAEDAVLVDTTDMTYDQVVARLVQLARERL
jgi:CMP/dCMP kinase